VDFDVTQDQRSLQDGIRSFLDGRYPMEAVREREGDADVVDRARWAELADMGVFSLLQQGFGVADASLVFEELGRALVPGPLVATFLAANLGFESPCVGLIEPAEPITVLEHPESVEQILVVLGGVISSLDRSALTLEPVVRPLDALTPLSVVTGPLSSGRLLADGADAARLVQIGTVLTAAIQVGVAARALELATEYAKGREQFGRPIGSFQAIKHMAADMFVKAELARVAVHAAAVCVDGSSNDSPHRTVSTAKFLANEAAIYCAKQAIQIHGGMGFTWEVDVQRYWKRACVLDTHFGSTDFHAERIAQLI
jgi:alkylation response protein AidB-like acyl-CoA dehydrogenase